MPATRCFVGEPHFLKNIHPFRKCYRLLQIVSLKFHDVYNLFPMNITFVPDNDHWVDLPCGHRHLARSIEWLFSSTKCIWHRVEPHPQCDAFHWGQSITSLNLQMHVVVWCHFYNLLSGYVPATHYNLQFCYPQNITQDFSLLNNTLDCYISVSHWIV